ncbi:phosphoadenosine phosphosulfate reductase domain-containing protein [Chitiniphilus eburneus]|uniref:Phosphoadenosine phosphosulfate reductase n=1 Tax=Chitiniphilus eburneus TaxID=2571148 RepID=A0A4U0Q3G9_9NEIS|nr:phosphoadenosine phosphosulfate reductase family protein [Chitiniphilus eburneus]TJZ75616.1 phosphoadenosine phosphosulfate reductase [Chitiniphilus eburneus]
MSIIHVVSVSGGKDSAATLLVALQRFGRHRVRAIFCDTGNEHQAVYDYLSYLELALDITIDRLKARFDQEIANKRMFIARDRRTRRAYHTRPVFDADNNPVWARDGRGNLRWTLAKDDGALYCALIQKTRKVGGGHKVRWSNRGKRRALSVLQPTGNSFLDLCLWRGRFPSPKAQFCTEQLKVAPAVEYQLGLVDEGHSVVSWQGVRRDESENRKNALKFERQAPGLYIYRPLVEWSAADVFKHCAAEGIQPNPLYRQGMTRVGCMPCINVNKNEMREIATRFPDEIARIAEWETLVSQASKRQAATFIPAPGITPDQASDHGIYSVVEWSRTSRGGRQYDLLASLIEPTACASAYGLCE